MHELEAGPEVYRRFVRVLLLTGMRGGECRGLKPAQVRGTVIQLGRETKTKKPRTIDLSVSPSVVELLADFRGWGFTKEQLRYLRRKLHPWVTFQRLRVTCGSYLTCAPAIYGGASAFMSAKRLGHSVQVSEDHYAGHVLGIPATAKTLEEAMGLTSED